MAHRRIPQKQNLKRGDRRGPPHGLDGNAVDRHAVDAYEELARTAHPARIEPAQLEAFEKLTPQQLELLFHRFLRTHSPAGASEDPESTRKSAIAARNRRGRLRRLLHLLHNPSLGTVLGGLALLNASGFIPGSAFPTPFAGDEGEEVRPEPRDQEPPAWSSA